MAAYQSVAAVFVGRVIRITAPKPRERRRCLAAMPAEQAFACYGNRVRIRIDKAWKGVAERTVTLEGGGTNCDYPFEVGREYIVYALPIEAQSSLTSNLCGLTRPVGRAKLDLELLGQPELDWSGDA